MDLSRSAPGVAGAVGRCSDCGRENLAREAQQQAQREEREGEETDADGGLRHGATIAESRCKNQ